VIRRSLAHISRLELIVAAIALVVLVVLVILEPKILEAPTQNGRTIAFTVGGTALAAISLVVLLALGVPPAARVLLLGTPFVIVNAWLLSPYFHDDVAQEDFVTTIANAPGPSAAIDSTLPGPASGPMLLGSGQLKGLAGHRGSGNAGIFRNSDGHLVVRLEDIDIQNGPDLELYLVPGADKRSLAKGSIHLGHLRGNVGNLTYDVPAGVTLEPGSWTVLIWCESFSVEFTGATVMIA
jgi:hypothetical protein